MAKNIGLVIIILGMLVLGFAFFMTGNLGGGKIFQPKDKITCNAIIQGGGLVTKPSLSSATCYLNGQCYFGFSAIPYDIWSQQGTITLSSGGSTSTQTYSAPNFYGSTTVQLSVCSDVHTWTVVLYDNSHSVLGQQQGTAS